ncbi:unnamed protein product [Phaedon cochleariae]|uniref:Leucine-rich repeat protein n=1 Tax=Phaedon cochleariae TaxID=80249 RepID=A0A9P0DTL1_PHACE|nr:unnamed protein product [Phaedon cochleariae]
MWMLFLWLILLICLNISYGIQMICPYEIHEQSKQVIIRCENVKFADNEPLKYQEPSRAFQDYQKALEIVNTTIPVLKFTNNTFTAFANFTVLNVSHAGLERIEPDAFFDMRKIEILYLTYNNISSVDSSYFDSLEVLKNLDLSNNLITNIDQNAFSKVKLLTTLNLSSNSLKLLGSFSSYGLYSVKVMDLSSNGLSSIDLGHINESLEVLTLIHNQINTVLGRGNSTSSSLSNLSLNANNIGHLQGDCFDNLDNLKHLDLSFNNLDSLPEDLFSSLNRIRYLNLSGNAIEELPSGIFDSSFYLQSLDVSKNALSDLKCDAGTWHNLYELNIQHNLISHIDVQGIVENATHLKYVALDGNNFDCDYLLEVIKLFSDNDVTVRKGNSIDAVNVDGNICYEKVKISSNYKSSILVTVLTILVVVIVILVVPWIVKYYKYIKAKRTRGEQLELL